MLLSYPFVCYVFSCQLFLVNFLKIIFYYAHFFCFEILYDPVVLYIAPLRIKILRNLIDSWYNNDIISVLPFMIIDVLSKALYIL